MTQFDNGSGTQQVWSQWAWYTMGLRHNLTMGLVHVGTHPIMLCPRPVGLAVHVESRTQQDLDTMHLVRSGTGTQWTRCAELKAWDTKGLERCRLCA